ncbi:MAG: replication initiator protein A [Pseudomonadota bacterium]
MPDGSASAARLFDHEALNTDEAPLSIGVNAHGVNSHGAHLSATAGHAQKISRDEMNLAEFPLTVLSKRADPSVKTLEFSDYVKGKNGDVINRTWIITGADKFGLPTSSDDEVLLGLLKLTADEGLNNRKVHFTRYELLRILRWTTEGRSYTRLQNALDRLSGVRIKASNAFYDNETKLHSTRNFGIIDAYEINDGRDTRPSFFTWSEVLFKSFQVGFIKKLDLDFYLDLESAVSKRLYRYLDKHFWYRSRMQVNLFTLAHEKIGVSRNYVYASSLRQQLEPALQELKEKGILSDYDFVGKGRSTEVILVAAHAPKRIATSATEPNSTNNQRITDSHSLRHQSQRDNPQSSSTNEPPLKLNEQVRTIKDALVERGLAEKQAVRLTAGQGGATLERMRAIIEHFDALLEKKSPLIRKSPTGFLYRAVERPSEFVLPGEQRKRGMESEQRIASEAKNSTEAARGLAELASNKKINLEVAYLTERKQRLDTVLANTTAQKRAAMKSEVESALEKLKAHISPQRFSEAVQHGVEQRLLENDGFPDFDAWVRER